MKATAKLSSQERRAAIIEAVQRVFAEKGFHGTTTRELAQAAGVSEALLFKHFPNKEALYSAMMALWCQRKDPKMVERLMALEPSASTLVLLVHLLVSHMVGERPVGNGQETIHNRLMLRSMLEDGEFARLFLQGMPSQWIRKLEECIKGAIAAGDAVNGAVRPNLRGWFAHQLTVMIMLALMPEKPVIDYGMARSRLVEQVVWFILRGIGLRDEVIKRHYNAKALALFAV
jgi:AcrR family transcriptional regulator